MQQSLFYLQFQRQRKSAALFVLKQQLIRL
jgi:hypothetical protein